MSGYLDHVHACNRFDPTRFRPLLHGAARIGWLGAEAAAALAAYPGVFDVRADAVSLVLGDADPARLTRAVDEVVEDLVGRGLVSKWRNEFFEVAARWGDAPLFELDRGAVSFFGVRSYGVHLNGVRRDGVDLTLWIGRRALDKKVAPGKLDNMVAGGIGAGHGLPGTLHKEAAEEADIPASLIRQAIPVGAITYRLETPGGLRDDTLFVYDLDVPAGFQPRNTDGEIADFRLLDAAECLRLVETTDAFKFNVNLVLIDFGIRHGLIGPNHPDYLALVRGLRQSG
ncbi:MAG TPA: DUF4743 domain-containing protein [Stellaceae bacterium]|nr:DUF4743 domain-containing protein [Stellaceae bacterium]